MALVCPSHSQVGVSLYVDPTLLPPCWNCPYVPTEFSLNRWFFSLPLLLVFSLCVCAGRHQRDKQTPYCEALLLSGESYILKVETSAKKSSMLHVTCCLTIYAEAFHKSNQN
ncbi:hypothetical protein RHSIM_Rhsim10G0187500 [Rhododendron simsii]|uniref:Uncharacterized protein n=1 Tax=Rhododendron simsii TaxID=118357 RepID=A0A834LCU6_RHOSS|nr:hypothetical protein RHSIM_Rhsim10G0187500 [Rhododendron simsii]